MKKLLFILLMLPIVAHAQFGVRPEVGIVLGKPGGELFEYLDLNAHVGFSVGAHAFYKLPFGAKFSLGAKYMSQKWGAYVARGDDPLIPHSTSVNFEYNSIHIPALAGYEIGFGNIMLFADAGVSYSFGLKYMEEDFSKNAFNLIVDCGVGYKLNSMLTLKLWGEYGKGLQDFTMEVSSEINPNKKLSLEIPYYFGIKVGVDIYF